MGERISEFFICASSFLQRPPAPRDCGPVQSARLDLAVQPFHLAFRLFIIDRRHVAQRQLTFEPLDGVFRRLE